MLLDYTTYTNVAGANDFFDKLRLWAISKGWTQEEWRVGYMWNTSSHWVADSRGRFLILSKAGYGTQNLIVGMATASRIRSDYTCFGIMGAMRSQVAYDQTTTQTHPVKQNTICGGVHNLTFSYTYTKDSNLGGIDIGENYTIPQVWFFAGPHWIAAFLKMDDKFCQWFHFGSIELFDDNPSQGQCWGQYALQYGGYLDEDYPFAWCWTNYKLLTSSTTSPGCISYDGIYGDSRVCGFDMYYGGRNFYLTTSTNIQYGKSNIQFPSVYMVSNHYPLHNIADALKANHFSSKRPLIKPIFSYQRSSDSVWVPIARAPFYACVTAGLEIGQQIDLDGASYLVFPDPTIYRAHGWALCINEGSLTTTTI